MSSHWNGFFHNREVSTSGSCLEETLFCAEILVRWGRGKDWWGGHIGAWLNYSFCERSICQWRVCVGMSVWILAVCAGISGAVPHLSVISANISSFAHQKGFQTHKNDENHSTRTNYKERNSTKSSRSSSAALNWLSQVSLFFLNTLTLSSSLSPAVFFLHKKPPSAFGYWGCFGMDSSSECLIGWRRKMDQVTCMVKERNYKKRKTNLASLVQENSLQLSMKPFPPLFKTRSVTKRKIKTILKVKLITEKVRKKMYFGLNIKHAFTFLDFILNRLL